MHCCCRARRDSIASIYSAHRSHFSTICLSGAYPALDLQQMVQKFSPFMNFSSSLYCRHYTLDRYGTNAPLHCDRESHLLAPWQQHSIKKVDLHWRPHGTFIRFYAQSVFWKSMDVQPPRSHQGLLLPVRHTVIFHDGRKYFADF